jgi:hypothetical protein
MQRTASVLLASLVAGLFMTGCPEKSVEKEDPAAPARAPRAKAAEHSATDDKADEEHGDEGAPDEHPDDSDEKRPLRHRRPDKKDPAAADANEGGW